MPQRFIPVAAPRADRPMTRIETGFAARRNVLEIIPALTYRHPMVTGNMLIRWHMLADPTGLKRVLLDNLANYPKSEIMRRMLRPAIGNSLFNADGADWRWQRRAVVPVFTHSNVVTLAPPMSATAERAIQIRGPGQAAAEIAVLGIGCGTGESQCGPFGYRRALSGYVYDHIRSGIGRHRHYYLIAAD